jgi:hypothetical protein
MMDKENDTITVYWAPSWIGNDTNNDIFYHEPISVYKDLLSKFNPPTATKNFMSCPAVKGNLENTFFILNPTDADMQVSFDKDGNIDGLRNNNVEHSAIPARLQHSPTLTNQLLIEYGMSYCFFSEEPLNVLMTSPYFHNTHYLNYGAIVPGGFDIGQWYRPFNFEINLWDGNGRLIIKKNEPLVYLKFDTDKKIVFKRYHASEKMHKIAASLVHFKDAPRWRKLITRYQFFNRADMRSVVLQEIKNNLIEA